jgi:hypothetical protein
VALAEDELEDLEEEEHIKCVYLGKGVQTMGCRERRKGYRHVPIVIKELGQGRVSTRKSTYFGGKGQGQE